MDKIIEMFREEGALVLTLSHRRRLRELALADGSTRREEEGSSSQASTSTTSSSTVLPAMSLEGMRKVKGKTAQFRHFKPDYKDCLTQAAIDYFKAKRKIWHDIMGRTEESHFTFQQAAQRFYYYDKRIIALESAKIARLKYIANEHFEIAAAQDKNDHGQRKAAEHMTKAQAWLNYAAEVFSYDESDHFEDQYLESYQAYHNAHNAM